MSIQPIQQGSDLEPQSQYPAVIEDSRTAGLAPRRLRAGLTVVRRNATTWQIGLNPDRAVIVSGGDHVGQTLRELSTATPPTTHRAAQVITALDQAGVLAPARTPSLSRVPVAVQRQLARDKDAQDLLGRDRELSHRRRAVVVVQGQPALTTAICVGLAYAGIGTVAPTGIHGEITSGDVAPGGPSASDVGREWSDVTSDLVRQWGGQTTVPTGQRIDLAIVVSASDADTPWCDPAYADPWLATDTPHLPVSVAGTAAEVGPLVQPGRTACLRCLDAVAEDLDPAWPLIRDLLRMRDRTPTAVPLVLAQIAAHTAVAWTLEHLAQQRLDGSSLSPDRSSRVQWTLPGPQQHTRPVLAHPGCGCAWGIDRGTMHM